MQQISYLAKFVDGWPVECILMQHLQNHIAYKRRKDCELEAAESATENESENEEEV